MSGASKKPSGLFAQRGATDELQISGTKVLLTLAIALGLALPLIWELVDFIYSYP